MNAKTMAGVINSGGSSFMVEEGDSFGSLLDQELKNLGWTTSESFSYCSKATFESHLKKDKSTVSIISAWFLGDFTEVTVKWQGEKKNESTRFIMEE